jgi:alpha-glucoside transport system permease protein
VSDLQAAPIYLVLALLLTFAGYWLANKIVEITPRKIAKAVRPYLFIGPVLALVGFTLLYPTFETIRFSFMNADSTEYVGLDNYGRLFGDPQFLTTLSNTLLWVAIVPAVTVICGIGIATLTDKLGGRRETIFKAIIFMPMAISFIAASSIWKLTYSWSANELQVGMLNAIIQAFGGTPFDFLQTDTFALNSLLLMVVVIWANVGFAMTLISAAIKGVPEETIEAGALDGATGWQSFYRIVLPQIRATAVSVFITVLIGVMKIFDVIWGMTGGNFHTNVLAVDFYLNYFVYLNTGKATAIVVLLMLAIVPVMFYQIRTYRKQEELR